MHSSPAASAAVLVAATVSLGIPVMGPELHPTARRLGLPQTWRARGCSIMPRGLPTCCYECNVHLHCAGASNCDRHSHVHMRCGGAVRESAVQWGRIAAAGRASAIAALSAAPRARPVQKEIAASTVPARVLPAAVHRSVDCLQSVQKSSRQKKPARSGIVANSWATS